MITTPDQYRKQLLDIQEKQFPRKAVLPYADTIYPIDLKSRVIHGPEFLSVLKEHDAENIYFSVPRYMDFMDLSQTACIIQYKKPNGKMGIYAVPFYDIRTYNKPGEEKLIFSWLLNADATAVSGPIEYSIMFFKINNAGTKFIYKLNTLPTTSVILNSLDVKDEDLDKPTNIDPTHYEEILNKIAQLNNKDIFWIEIN